MTTILTGTLLAVVSLVPGSSTPVTAHTAEPRPQVIFLPELCEQFPILCR